MTETIPGPPGLPIVGNLTDIDPADTVNSLARLADTYGMPLTSKYSILLTIPGPDI